MITQLLNWLHPLCMLMHRKYWHYAPFGFHALCQKCGNLIFWDKLHGKKETR